MQLCIYFSIKIQFELVQVGSCDRAVPVNGEPHLFAEMT